MMNEQNKIILENQHARLQMDLCGGALSSFILKKDGVNPLNFRLPKDFQDQKFYSGHFICLPRWGDGPASDIRKIKHGDFSELNWKIENYSDQKVSAAAYSEIEGISVHRDLRLDSRQPVFHVRERIKNQTDNALNYNFVQHPTIAKPFLDEELILNFNSSGQGYRYINNFRDIEKFSIRPDALNVRDTFFQNPFAAGLYCFPLSPESEFGWISAYSPRLNLLLGYIWSRKLFPWINIWIHYEGSELKYCGLEFGTTGLHFSCEDIVQQGRAQLAGLPAVHNLPAGSMREFSYTGFLLEPDAPFTGIDFIHQNKTTISWRPKGELKTNFIETDLINYHELD